MSAEQEYLQRLRRLIAQVEAALTLEERATVERLIDHDEGGEAMLTLAWILVEGDRRVPVAAIGEIRKLAAGMIDPGDFPPNLDACGIR